MFKIFFTCTILSSWVNPSLSPIPGLVQNTYTNADKLLEAAEQLAQTGECDPEEIYQAAHQLEDRIQDFVRRVEQRKVLLDMSVAFHTHVKEVSGVDGIMLKRMVGCVFGRAFTALTEQEGNNYQMRQNCLYV